MLLSFQYSVSCSHPEQSGPSEHRETRGKTTRDAVVKMPYPYKRPELFIDPVIDAILTALFVRLP
jgi:hypothetical protein